MTVTLPHPTAQIVDQMTDRIGSHGDLDCVDAETMLHEVTMENAHLRARLATVLADRAAMESEIDLMRLDGDRLRALLSDVSTKNTHLTEERDDLTAQVKFLNEELAAVEADAVPEGTLLFAALAREEMVAQYRRASRITRGPLPPSVLAVVDGAREEIAEAMREAGREALKVVVGREVRRRRRVQRARR